MECVCWDGLATLRDSLESTYQEGEWRMSLRTALVTDSTCNLPEDLAAQHRIYVAPLYVLWGEDTYRDGIDITEPEFYRRLRQGGEIPSTSQVSAQDFVDLFNRAREQENAEAVVCAVLSNELSGTYASALQAQAAVEFPVFVVDTKQVSWSLGLAMLAAADARDSGASPIEIAEHVKSAAKRTKLIFTIESLEYLHRGGRIGQARLLLGSALNIKPVLELRDGIVHSTESVRTRKRALERIVKLAKQYSGGRAVRRLAVLHADVGSEAEALLEAATAALEPDDAYSSYATTVIGVHAGPGAIGLAIEYHPD